MKIGDYKTRLGADSLMNWCLAKIITICGSIIKFIYLSSTGKRKYLVWQINNKPKILSLIVILAVSSCHINNSNLLRGTVEPPISTEEPFDSMESNSPQASDATMDLFPESWNPGAKNLSRQCAIKKDIFSPPENTQLIGFIRIDDGFALAKLTSDFSWEVIPNTQDSLPLGFSPNAKWLSLVIRQDNSTDLLRVIDAKGTVIDHEIEFLLNTDSRWLNNDLMIMIPNDKQKQRYLFNPFTNESLPFPSFPNEKIDERFANVYWFSPNGMKVAYLETDEKYRSYYSLEKHVIYDVKTGKNVETGLNWVISPPAWSPDGKLIALVSLGRLHVIRQIPSHEIFLADASTGESRQFSDFFNMFGGVFISGLSWSPNGRYMLFELDLIDDSLPESFEPSLYLLDLRTEQIIDLCLDEISERSYYWSYSGQMVGWHSRLGDMYLLDVTTGDLFFQSSPKVGLIGWLTSDEME